MIKEYLARISTDLSRFNQTLSKTSILIDKPWALVDDNNEIQKLIFKKNNELILSKNGKAEVGKWEYFPEAKSLLIDRGTDKIFCNEIFIDNGVIILKLDGTKNDFFALANENIISDLNVVKYLDNLVERNFTPSVKRVYLLENDKKIEVHSKKHIDFLENKDTKVTFENNNVNDGFYKLKNTRLTLVVKNSLITTTLSEYEYLLDDNRKLKILQKNQFDVSINDYVLIDSKLVEDDFFFLHKNKKIKTKNGLIEKIWFRRNILGFTFGDFREAK